jgi:hypothetical protein
MLSSRDHTAGQIGMLGFCSVLHAIVLAPLFVETGRERKRKGALMQRRSPGRFSRPALSGAWDRLVSPQPHPCSLTIAAVLLRARVRRRRIHTYTKCHFVPTCEVRQRCEEKWAPQSQVVRVVLLVKASEL